MRERVESEFVMFPKQFVGEMFPKQIVGDVSKISHKLFFLKTFISGFSKISPIFLIKESYLLLIIVSFGT